MKFIYHALLLPVIFVLSSCDSPVSESISEENDNPPEETELFKPNITTEFEGDVIWIEYGLDESETSDLFFHGEYLFAIADGALFHRNIHDAGSIWEPAGFETDTVRVRGLAVLNENDWIVSVVHEADESVEMDYESHPLLYRTHNGGLDWEPETSTQTVGTGRQHFVQDGKPETLWFSPGHAVHRSDDFGKTWNLIRSRNSTHLLRSSEYHPGHIWATVTPVIQTVRSEFTDDNGESWEIVRNVGGDKIIFSPVSTEMYLRINTSDFMFRSDDGAQSWDIIVDPRIEDIHAVTAVYGKTGDELLFAGGKLGTGEGVKEGYQVYFEVERAAGNPYILISDDHGDSWEISFNRELTDLTVLQIISTDLEGQDILFVNTSQGIYRVEFDEEE